MNLLRFLFSLLWGLKFLRPMVIRWWPAQKLDVGGHTYMLHPADNYTERFMWRKGLRCEAASIGRLTLLCAGKRALIFDIGANCGAFTLPLATSAGIDSRIVAFEPHPVMAGRLRSNLKLNCLTNRVEVVEVALGETYGDAVLHLVVGNLGQSSLRTVDCRGVAKVVVRPLVHYLPEQLQRFEIFIIKIDVEGLEDQVLVPFLTSIPEISMPDAILIETHNENSWSTDLRSTLEQVGYIPFFEGEEQNTLFVRFVGNHKRCGQSLRTVTESH